MKKTISIVLVILMVLILGASPVLASTDNALAYAHQPKKGQGNGFAPDRILVSFKQNIGPSEMAMVHRQCGGQVTGELAAACAFALAEPGTRQVPAFVRHRRAMMSHDLEPGLSVR